MIQIFLIQLCNICYAQLIPAGWFQQPSLITTKLNSVFFSDKLSGWIVGDGGVMLYSTNGGSNWQRQLNNISGNLTKIFFSSSETGYVIGTTGLIIETTNGGTTWYQQTSGTINDLKVYN